VFGDTNGAETVLLGPFCPRLGVRSEAFLQLSEKVGKTVIRAIRSGRQRVASILTCPQVDVTSANQTNPSSRPHVCIMRVGHVQ
jgi:hypothetical protein